MAEQRNSESSIMDRFLLNWNFESLQAADEELFVDGESELSDAISVESSMEIDMHPFESKKSLDPKFQPNFDGICARSLLPLELVEMIAINIADDADLISFILSCKDFALAAVLEKSTVWRRRFLARYDHPIIEGPYEFRVAYQLRELVLRKFPSFADGGGARGRVALEVLRDMVLESVKASRENYDLSIIYLYGAPLETIHQPRAQQTMDLDLNALLHIRNFWHGHLASNLKGTYADTANTYGMMARKLDKHHHAPRQWDAPIQQLSGVSTRWFGHYSCTHSTPRKRMDIEEHQTCAEDWIHQFGPKGVHPLTLDIATTTSLHCGWWPPIFLTIPILEHKTQGVDLDPGRVCIRGIAPFLSPRKHPDMYPAYTALRMRGFIDPLPEQEEIPGWRRIVMVLYKPTSRYLLAVLDESSPDDEDDNPFGQLDALAALMSPNVSVGQNSGQVQAPTQGLAQFQIQNQQPPQDQGQVQTQTMPANPEAEEKAMKEELEAREELKGPLGPTYLTRDTIAKMEDNLHPPEELAWEDINYAYAYEGVVIPGGKIMMGRYWRFGAPNAAVGYELGEGADRGPWIFWS